MKLPDHVEIRAELTEGPLLTRLYELADEVTVLRAKLEMMTECRDRWYVRAAMARRRIIELETGQTPDELIASVEAAGERVEDVADHAIALARGEVQTPDDPDTYCDPDVLEWEESE